jgi:ribosome maturation factor RimP
VNAERSKAVLFFTRRAKAGETVQHFNRHEIIEKLTPVVENTAMRYNLIPIEISLEKENAHWFLRIFIYSNDHPVSHQDCENLTRGLDSFLDELMPFKYYLEVSSPGLDRKIKSEREYLIFKGSQAVLKLKEPIDKEEEILVGKKTEKVGGERKIRVKILDYNPGFGLKILKLNTNKEYIIKLENITSARLEEK